MHWQQKYLDGGTPWDLRGITPPLLRLLASGRLAGFGLPAAARVAVPGCGRGHDLRAWAGFGHQATGFDLAPAAVAEANELLRLNRCFGPRVLCRDVLGLAAEFAEHFDLVYDYTCFCALPPDLRSAYADSMADALRPGGLLLQLMFPMVKADNPAGGPPYLLDSEVLRGAYQRRFEAVAEFEAEGSPPSRAGAERWSLWRRR